MKISPNGDRGCYTYKGCFIPMCWGSVNHGPRGCYCKVKPETDEVKLAVAMNHRLQSMQDEIIEFRRMFKVFRKSIRKFAALKPHAGGA